MGIGRKPLREKVLYFAIDNIVIHVHTMLMGLKMSGNEVKYNEELQALQAPAFAKYKANFEAYEQVLKHCGEYCGPAQPHYSLFKISMLVEDPDAV